MSRAAKVLDRLPRLRLAVRIEAENDRLFKVFSLSAGRLLHARSSIAEIF
jgi:hypothetical protein